MYRTIQTACKQAIRAHNKEKKTHVIFKEMGLYRIKPVEEIGEIDQQAIYGWTVPKWDELALYPELSFPEIRARFPMGNNSFVRKQFYKKECYYSPEHTGLKLYNKYSRKEIEYLILHGQNL